ncbi:SDR family oxidoreductase [Pseudonocardia kujensis]|uniref:SDR family NAD(P)-dependent oxidoreductase n=1 Tax=Pseudonocardia kujensis TaxID=1128675 RepID=UPI001E35439B|nr:SDR family oxidoreductase [Pseudonocardia kujensis]MCE0764900.1 SDR family oxidoreductase [Pseudonocardia kujensis]
MNGVRGPQRLSGKVAVVTGAAMGIGRAVARTFADEGAWVVAVDVAPFDRDYPLVEQRFLDVTSEQGWADLADHVRTRYGRVDILANVAGVIGYDPLDELELAEWERIIGVDQTGVFLGMRAFLPAMLDAGAGSVINFSSDWGVVGGVGVTAYNAAKGAVGSLSRNAAVTYAAQGIRVNALVPGWIRTPLTDRQPPDANARVIGSTPVGHGGDPADIAWACVYLASDESRFVTGTDFVVDGGFLAT